MLLAPPPHPPPRSTHTHTHTPEDEEERTRVQEAVIAALTAAGCVCRVCVCARRFGAGEDVRGGVAAALAATSTQV
jgi:hypothetical protein